MSSSSSQKAYAKAGVDVDLGNRVKSKIPALVKKTHRPEVLGKIGGFGGLFAFNTTSYRKPVLVSSVDGVGTKLKIAFALDRHDTIGQDLVNHCVNDILVLGAEPLFFLDYLGMGKLKPHVFEEIIKGFAKACAENNCALIGGETAQLPGFYQPGEYDVAGTIVGVVEKSSMMDGTKIRAGDVVIGLPSSGLHTNGYSLARKVLFEQMKLKPTSRLAELGRESVGEVLLKVHVSYFQTVQQILKKFFSAVHGMAHITGGGFVDNIPRVLPKSVNVRIDRASWQVPPIFQVIQKGGGIPEAEMYQVFNLGIGYVLIVSAKEAGNVLSYLRKLKAKPQVIGEVVRGNGIVQLA